MDSIPVLVSTQWLNEQIKNPSAQKLRILDVTWYPDRDAKEDFTVQHIPGAVYFNAFEGVELTPVYVRKLADAATFQTNVRGTGIDNDSHVIVYDSCQGNNGFLLGPRVWFMFKIYGHDRVSVLDGGLEKWIADGYEVTRETQKIPEGNFEAKDYSKKFVRTYQDMVERLKAKDAQPVGDGSPPALYNGNADVPKSGHYPGAVNIPGTIVVDKNKGCLKTVDELKQIFKDAGIDLSKPATFVCAGGIFSCSLALSAAICGCQQYDVYMGAMLEWKDKADEKYFEKSC